jgi:CheY-like chemotaxis protein
MTALLVVLMFVAFVALDALVRHTARRMQETRVRREREAVLATAVRLDFRHEAPSLKRVDVPNPKARILAVDDEPVILDSFRKILVLDGFSVDTVENGPEALGLVQRHDYDFVFTDLKMPEMDGVEVVKAVKHLRPDIDMAVITGFATIETAVETMQHGAVDYVQKPFTAEELSEFAKKLLIRREARLEAQRRPSVRVVAPSTAEAVPAHEFCVPGGAFVAPGHTWARIEPGGQVRIGLDDFARKALGGVERIEAAPRGTKVRQGEPLFTAYRARNKVQFLAPVGGEVVQANDDLAADARRAVESPYDRGWVCLIQPADLATELAALRIGKPVIAWYQDEITRLRKLRDAGAGLPAWEDLEREFLAPAALDRR